MTKHEGNPNDEARRAWRALYLCVLPLVILSSFVIRASSFVSRAAHPGNFRQTQDCAEDALALGGFDFVDRNRVRNIDPSRLGASKKFKMPAATQHFTDIVHIGAHIKTF